MRPGDLLLDRWRVLAPLGQGGMGRVDLVQDLRTGGRYALKTLLSGGDAEARLRFLREAEALARAEHPHVVRVHALEQGPGGALHLLVEHLEGGDLAGRLARDGPLPADEVRALGIALAAGLAHAHAVGVLHRDLKPHNVLLAADGTPKLADFGLARLSGARTLTATGEVMGTPETMAPEQARGDEVGPWTDVYGLGAVLYWAATGRPPHGAGSPLQLLARLGEPPPSPSRLRPGIPPDLEAVILRALAPDPAARWSSAAALGAALAGSIPAMAGPGVRRFLAALLLLGLLLGAAGLGWTLTRLPEASRPAPVGPPAPPPAVAPPAPPADPVAERLAAEDGAGALAALASRAATRPTDGDLDRLATLALLLHPRPEAELPRWRALLPSGGLLVGLEAGLTGRDAGPLQPLFAAERALEAALSLENIVMRFEETHASLPRHAAALLQAADRLAVELRSDAPRARARWRVFRLVPYLYRDPERAAPPETRWLEQLPRGPRESSTGRALELAVACLAAARRAEEREGMAIAPALAAQADALGPPCGEQARALVRLANLRAMAPARDLAEAASVLAAWRSFCEALSAWKGDPGGFLRSGDVDRELLGRQLVPATRRGLDACLLLGWAGSALPPETDELLAGYTAVFPEARLREREVAVHLLRGSPAEAAAALPAPFEDAPRDEAQRLLCLAEIALARGELDQALSWASSSEQAALLGGSRTDLWPVECVRAVALAARALARGADAAADEAAADAALARARRLPQNREFGWLPWRTPEASAAAIAAIRAGRWRPGSGALAPFPPRR